MAKREYRGKREVDAFINFVREQTTDPIEEYSDLASLTNLDVSTEKSYEPKLFRYRIFFFLHFDFRERSATS